MNEEYFRIKLPTVMRYSREKKQQERAQQHKIIQLIKPSNCDYKRQNSLH